MSNVYVYQPMLDLLISIREKRKLSEAEAGLDLWRRRHEIRHLEAELERCCSDSVRDWQKHWNSDVTLAEFLRSDLVKMTVAADPEWKKTFEELLRYLLNCVERGHSQGVTYQQASGWGAMMLIVVGSVAIIHWISKIFY